MSNADQSDHPPKLKVLFELEAEARNCGCVPAGSTNSVMLCAGSVLLNVPPLKVRSLK
ncbi:MAG: hypothetical protein WDN00_16970 [Limisphaerales bacterium]